MALVVPISYLATFLIAAQLLPVPIALTLSIPAMLYVAASLFMVGLASDFRPKIDRGSLLWSWISFIGVATKGVFALIAGIVVGTSATLIVGSGPTIPFTSLRLAGYWLLVVIASWLVLSIIVWIVKASFDVAGRKNELRENLARYLEHKQIAHARQLAVFFEDGATVNFVVLTGLGFLLAIVGVFVWLGSLLGFG